MAKIEIRDKDVYMCGEVEEKLFCLSALVKRLVTQIIVENTIHDKNIDAENIHKMYNSILTKAFADAKKEYLNKSLGLTENEKLLYENGVLKKLKGDSRKMLTAIITSMTVLGAKNNVSASVIDRIINGVDDFTNKAIQIDTTELVLCHLNNFKLINGKIEAYYMPLHEKVVSAKVLLELIKAGKNEATECIKDKTIIYKHKKEVLSITLITSSNTKEIIDILEDFYNKNYKRFDEKGKMMIETVSETVMYELLKKGSYVFNGEI